MRKDIGIAGLIVVAMMLVMVPTASAGEAFTWVGNATYSTNGTWVPDGWTIKMENLNETYPTEPWSQVTGQYVMWTAHCDGETGLSDDTWIYVNLTSPDGRWFGEFSDRLGDMDTWSGKYIHDVVLYEQVPPAETFTKNLVASWNLVSLPLTPEDNSVSAVLGSIAGNYDAVKSYNTATDQFEDASTMDPGIGYFVHVTTVGTWEYKGTAYESMNADLSEGLNMVGWTNISEDIPDALSSIDGNYRYIARWDATSQSYEVYLPGAPAVFNDFTTMEGGEGYFIAATSSCTLAYPSP
ncbi:MAG: hypothetical protein HF976_10910 [ANME-2 cluster archaeon]|nr:hypothetical protein [ANME-2 cluster archaeon]MBC2701897.1 hypothetical protein [ANME-2 cluster archaeon]MBC2707843.1 hypothetical protein [ANME-2 cluster archaeon]MBC2747874.1 hypothetical protein [ANME-2 cluster archaeon]